MMVRRLWVWFATDPYTFEIVIPIPINILKRMLKYFIIFWVFYLTFLVGQHWHEFLYMVIYNLIHGTVS